MAGVDGDWYLNTTSGEIFHKEGGSWVSKGNLKGPQGSQGEIGPQGDKGDTGDKGDKGDTGDTGAAGPMWLSGAGDPT